MSFDYLNDVFGRFRKKRKTKYTDIEKRAVSLLQDYYAKKINANDFGEAMKAINDEFYKLMYDAEKESYVFDENTPGWLNLFLGNKFRPWYEFHQSFNMARNNPKFTSDPRWPEVECRADSEDKALMEAIKYCLKQYRHR